MPPVRVLARALHTPVAVPAPRFQASLSTTTAAMAAMAAPKKNDWSADQYLKFGHERTRAVHDLVNRIPLPGGLYPPAPGPRTSQPLRIVDLGCGPGNSTAVLADRFPGASVSGSDASPDMIAKARTTLPHLDFCEADLRTYDPRADGRAPALLLANAVFQWLPRAERIPTILRLLDGLESGGVLAFQMPDTQSERTHAAIRDVAAAPGAPWASVLAGVVDRDPVESVKELYDALAPVSASVDIWHSIYNHTMRRGAADIVEWMRGTGLQPWVNALPTVTLKRQFLQAYEARLAELYDTRVDGTVLIHYPRLFVVAVK